MRRLTGSAQNSWIGITWVADTLFGSCFWVGFFYPIDKCDSKMANVNRSRLVQKMHFASSTFIFVIIFLGSIFMVHVIPSPPCKVPRDVETLSWYGKLWGELPKLTFRSKSISENCSFAITSDQVYSNARFFEYSSNRTAHLLACSRFQTFNLFDC